MTYFNLQRCAMLSLRITQSDIDHARELLESGGTSEGNPFKVALARLGLRTEPHHGWLYFYRRDEFIGEFLRKPSDNIWKRWPPSRGGKELTPRTLLFKDPYRKPLPGGKLDFSSGRANGSGVTRGKNGQTNN